MTHYFKHKGNNYKSKEVEFSQVLLSYCFSRRMRRNITSGSFDIAERSGIFSENNKSNTCKLQDLNPVRVVII